jgi:hypothetical protein
VSEIRSFWRNVMTFAEVAEVPLRYLVFLSFLRAAKPQMCSLFIVVDEREFQKVRNFNG